MDAFYALIQESISAFCPYKSVKRKKPPVILVSEVKNKTYG